jgi:hypothetical protein
MWEYSIKDKPPRSYDSRAKDETDKDKRRRLDSVGFGDLLRTPAADLVLNRVDNVN